MDSNFSATGKAARELIVVPELPMDLIRVRSRRATTRERVRALIVYCAIGIALLGAGAAVGQKLYDGVRVWLSGGKAAVSIGSFVMVREPTASDLRHVVERASFPIVFPVPVPTGTRMTMLIFAPAERPNFVEVHYHNEGTNFNIGFSLIDSTTINTNETTLPSSTWQPSSYQWRVGRELVLAPRFAHTPSIDMNRIKQAMMQSSPASSLAFTETTLRKVVVLGVRPELAVVAERYAPRTGRSVLLDPQLTARIPNMVREDKPVVDDRIVYLSNIPTVRGEPDYSKATLHWPRVILIPAAGVRAINAALRFNSAQRDCHCVILFNQPDPATYWVWKFPLSQALRVKKYAVDAKTFAVAVAPL